MFMVYFLSLCIIIILLLFMLLIYAVIGYIMFSDMITHNDQNE